MPNHSDLEGILKEIFLQSGLDFVCLVNDPKLWTLALSRIDYISTNLLPSIINYEAVYASDDCNSSVNLSLILMHDGRPCAVWPLIFTLVKNDTDSISHCVPIQAPRFIQGVSFRTIGRIVAKCYLAISNLISRFNIRNLQIIDGFDGSQVGINAWHRQALKSEANILLRYDLYLDLQTGLEGIRSHIRPSYKPLINSGKRLWGVHILTNADLNVWAEFRELHQQVAGRVTRSSATWCLQLDAIAQKDAFLVYLRDETNAMIGGALFFCSRDEGLYAVGAYDRTRFDSPVGHVVQYIAIQEMLARGLKWYKIGDRPFVHQQPKPSAKELTIADFKQGFSSHIISKYIFTHV